jgi:uncharacterized protein (TIGR02217 family)
MSFLNVEFPSCIAMGAVGTPTWFTSVSENQGGWEQRNQIWSYDKHVYDVSTAVKSVDDYRLVLTHFNEMRGRLNTFPFKDFLDFEVEEGEGVTAYVSPGVYQLEKMYGTVNPYLRKITRPVAAAVSAGTLDTATGLVTVAADQTRSINSHAVGTTHQFTLASAFSPNVLIGQSVYPTGVTGSAASLLNGLRLEVTAVAAGVVSVDVNTTGLTATGGSLRMFPDPEEITWTGEFRVPVRYGVDRLPGQVVNSNGVSLFVQASSITLNEVRE